MTDSGVLPRADPFHLQFAPLYRAESRVDVGNFYIDEFTDHIRCALKLTTRLFSVRPESSMMLLRVYLLPEYAGWCRASGGSMPSLLINTFL